LVSITMFGFLVLILLKPHFLAINFSFITIIKDSTGLGKVPYLFTQSVANSVNSLLFEHSVADL